MSQIKKDTSLRKAILQAAITGQLISDVEGTTETGKELLGRIIEERNKKLLAEWEEKQTDLFASNDAHSKNAKTVRSEQIRLSKKIKKPEPIVASEINEEEIPFEIPENWCWCRWGELSESIQYGYNAPAKESGRIKMVRITDIQNGKVQWDTVPFCEISEEEIKTYRLRKNDILFARTGGTVGKSFLVDEEPENAVYAGYLIRTQYNSEKLNPKYMKMFMESQLYWDQLKNGTIATAQPNCNGQTLSKMILPLPPLAVQNSIVAKLEQVLPLVDAYENAVLQKEELKAALPDKVKKAILQEAITGQLTETWRKTANIKESGKQLLDRIIEERNEKALAEWEEAVKNNSKAKKPVAVVASEIEEEDIPFEVPESWCWCRLGDLGDFIRGSGIKRDETRTEGYPCIRYGEMYTKYKTVINETVSFVEKNVFDKCQKIIKNDIAMALTGENEYDIALAAVYTGDKEVAMGGDMTRFRPAFVNSLFLVFALNSPYGIECKSELATGNIIVHISNDKLGSIMIPLPPLEEQEEIVKKVEELLPLCEKLGAQEK